MNAIFKSILLICLVCTQLLQHIAGENLRSVELRNLAGHITGDMTNHTMVPSSDDAASGDDHDHDHDDHGPAAIPGAIPTMAGMDDD